MKGFAVDRHASLSQDVQRHDFRFRDEHIGAEDAPMENRCLTASAPATAQEQYHVGAAYDRSGSARLAALWYRRAAAMGSADAQFALGLLCLQPDSGCAQRLAPAARWFRLAAQQGHAEAQFRLALTYEQADAVPADDRELARWMQMAAKQGHAEAQYRLAVLYATGRGVSLVMALAEHWYAQAAIRGHREARACLELLLDMNGYGRCSGCRGSRERTSRIKSEDAALCERLQRSMKWPPATST